MINGIITIQSYVRMRLMRSHLKHRQYKHSNDMMIQELHRHPKFSRVCFCFSRQNKSFLFSQYLIMKKQLFLFNLVFVVIFNVIDQDNNF
jgi:hypothetical protein